MKKRKTSNVVESSEIYGIRLLIFIETEPQSNKYNQILLTQDQFRKISLKIGQVVVQEGPRQTVKMETSEEEYELPDLQQVTQEKRL